MFALNIGQFWLMLFIVYIVCVCISWKQNPSIRQAGQYDNFSTVIF